MMLWERALASFLFLCISLMLVDAQEAPAAAHLEEQQKVLHGMVNELSVGGTVRAAFLEAAGTPSLAPTTSAIDKIAKAYETLTGLGEISGPISLSTRQRYMSLAAVMIAYLASKQEWEGSTAAQQYHALCVHWAQIAYDNVLASRNHLQVRLPDTTPEEELMIGNNRRNLNSLAVEALAILATRNAPALDGTPVTRSMVSAAYAEIAPTDIEKYASNSPDLKAVNDNVPTETIPPKVLLEKSWFNGMLLGLGLGLFLLLLLICIIADLRKIIMGVASREFLRFGMSISAGLVGSSLPGLFELKADFLGIGIRAVGGLAFFFWAYKYPPGLSQNHPPPPPPPTTGTPSPNPI